MSGVSPSWARPGACSMRCSPPSACSAGTTCTSPTRSNAVRPTTAHPRPTSWRPASPYLRRQIELIKPRLIVALGRPAAQALLNQEVKISAARGRTFRYGDIPVVVTYHPAYLLRNQPDKAKAWEDLCFARKTMRALRDEA